MVFRNVCLLSYIIVAVVIADPGVCADLRK